MSEPLQRIADSERMEPQVSRAIRHSQKKNQILPKFIYDRLNDSKRSDAQTTSKDNMKTPVRKGEKDSKDSRESRTSDDNPRESDDKPKKADSKSQNSDSKLRKSDSRIRSRDGKSRNRIGKKKKMRFNDSPTKDLYNHILCSNMASGVKLDSERDETRTIGVETINESILMDTRLMDLENTVDGSERSVVDEIDKSIVLDTTGIKTKSKESAVQHVLNSLTSSLKKEDSPAKLSLREVLQKKNDAERSHRLSDFDDSDVVGCQTSTANGENFMKSTVNSNHRKGSSSVPSPQRVSCVADTVFVSEKTVLGRETTPCPRVDNPIVFLVKDSEHVENQSASKEKRITCFEKQQVDKDWSHVEVQPSRENRLSVVHESLGVSRNSDEFCALDDHRNALLSSMSPATTTHRTIDMHPLSSRGKSGKSIGEDLTHVKGGSKSPHLILPEAAQVRLSDKSPPRRILVDSPNKISVNLAEIDFQLGGSPSKLSGGSPLKITRSPKLANSPTVCVAPAWSPTMSPQFETSPKLKSPPKLRSSPKVFACPKLGGTPMKSELKSEVCKPYQDNLPRKEEIGVANARLPCLEGECDKKLLRAESPRKDAAGEGPASWLSRVFQFDSPKNKRKSPKNKKVSEDLKKSVNYTMSKTEEQMVKAVNQDVELPVKGESCAENVDRQEVQTEKVVEKEERENPIFDIKGLYVPTVKPVSPLNEGRRLFGLSPVYDKKGEELGDAAIEIDPDKSSDSPIKIHHTRVQVKTPVLQKTPIFSPMLRGPNSPLFGVGIPNLSNSAGISNTSFVRSPCVTTNNIENCVTHAPSNMGNVLPQQQLLASIGNSAKVLPRGGIPPSTKEKTKQTFDMQTNLLHTNNVSISGVNKSSSISISRSGTNSSTSSETSSVVTLLPGEPPKNTQLPRNGHVTIAKCVVPNEVPNDGLNHRVTLERKDWKEKTSYRISSGKPSAVPGSTMAKQHDVKHTINHTPAGATAANVMEADPLLQEANSCYSKSKESLDAIWKDKKDVKNGDGKSCSTSPCKTATSPRKSDTREHVSKPPGELQKPSGELSKPTGVAMRKSPTLNFDGFQEIWEKARGGEAKLNHSASAPDLAMIASIMKSMDKSIGNKSFENSTVGNKSFGSNEPCGNSTIDSNGNMRKAIPQEKVIPQEGLRISPVYENSFESASLSSGPTRSPVRSVDPTRLDPTLSRSASPSRLVVKRSTKTLERLDEEIAVSNKIYRLDLLSQIMSDGLPYSINSNAKFPRLPPASGAFRHFTQSPVCFNEFPVMVNHLPHKFNDPPLKNLVSADSLLEKARLERSISAEGTKGEERAKDDKPAEQRLSSPAAVQHSTRPAKAGARFVYVSSNRIPPKRSPFHGSSGESKRSPSPPMHFYNGARTGFSLEQDNWIFHPPVEKSPAEKLEKRPSVSEILTSSVKLRSGKKKIIVSVTKSETSVASSVSPFKSTTSLSPKKSSSPKKTSPKKSPLKSSHSPKKSKGKKDSSRGGGSSSRANGPMRFTSVAPAEKGEKSYAKTIIEKVERMFTQEAEATETESIKVPLKESCSLANVIKGRSKGGNLTKKSPGITQSSPKTMNTNTNRAVQSSPMTIMKTSLVKRSPVAVTQSSPMKLQSSPMKLASSPMKVMPCSSVKTPTATWGAPKKIAPTKTVSMSHEVKREFVSNLLKEKKQNAMGMKEGAMDKKEAPTEKKEGPIMKHEKEGPLRMISSDALHDIARERRPWSPVVEKRRDSTPKGRGLKDNRAASKTPKWSKERPWSPGAVSPMPFERMRGDQELLEHTVDFGQADASTPPLPVQDDVVPDDISSSPASTENIFPVTVGEESPDSPRDDPVASKEDLVDYNRIVDALTRLQDYQMSPKGRYQMSPKSPTAVLKKKVDSKEGFLFYKEQNSLKQHGYKEKTPVDDIFTMLDTAISKEHEEISCLKSNRTISDIELSADETVNGDGGVKDNDISNDERDKKPLNFAEITKVFERTAETPKTEKIQESKITTQQVELAEVDNDEKSVDDDDAASHGISNDSCNENSLRVNASDANPGRSKPDVASLLCIKPSDFSSVRSPARSPLRGTAIDVSPLHPSPFPSSRGPLCVSPSNIPRFSSAVADKRSLSARRRVRWNEYVSERSISAEKSFSLSPASRKDEYMFFNGAKALQKGAKPPQKLFSRVIPKVIQLVDIPLNSGASDDGNVTAKEAQKTSKSIPGIASSPVSVAHSASVSHSASVASSPGKTPTSSSWRTKVAQRALKKAKTTEETIPKSKWIPTAVEVRRKAIATEMRTALGFNVMANGLVLKRSRSWSSMPKRNARGKSKTRSQSWDRSNQNRNNQSRNGGCYQVSMEGRMSLPAREFVGARIVVNTDGRAILSPLKTTPVESLNGSTSSKRTRSEMSTGTRRRNIMPKKKPILLKTGSSTSGKVCGPSEGRGTSQPKRRAKADDKGNAVGCRRTKSADSSENESPNTRSFPFKTLSEMGKMISKSSNGSEGAVETAQYIGEKSNTQIRSLASWLLGKKNNESTK